jgi:hypothetical protein
VSERTCTPMPESAWGRFWAKVDASGDCWEWTAHRFSNGYGQFRVGGRGENHRGAHRVVWEMLIGPIPDGWEVDHWCKNRGCVNPDHLEPVPQRVNLMRSGAWSAVNARKTHCPKDHPYTEANTRWDHGRRHCRACDRARPRREASARKAN